MKEDTNYKPIDPIDISFLPNGSVNVITDPLELFLQELFLAIQSGSDAIWGIPESINLNRYLFNKHLTITQIQNEIKTYVLHHCSMCTVFNWDVKASFKNIDGNDIILIEFKINVPIKDSPGDYEEVLQHFLINN
jgi:hypothetical protein